MILNYLLGVVVKFVVVPFLQKELCCDRNLLCFVSLYHHGSCLVLVAYNKINILCPFCLISNLFNLGNIIFNSASHWWIISDVKQKSMKYLLNIGQVPFLKQLYVLCSVLISEFDTFQKLFKETELDIVIKCNMKIVNYLDVILNFENSTYLPYQKKYN